MCVKRKQRNKHKSFQDVCRGSGRGENGIVVPARKKGPWNHPSLVDSSRPSRAASLLQSSSWGTSEAPTSPTNSPPLTNPNLSKKTRLPTLNDRQTRTSCFVVCRRPKPSYSE
jgi:hypothetical protein